MPVILPKTGLFEFEEKKSKFLGFCSPIQTEQEAKDIIEQTRIRHKNANHNVFAYSIPEINVIRASDDGEPSGTAGLPVLNVFQKAGVINFCCIVTRYFGGTMLGAGGLVRAYTKTAKGAMLSAGPEELVITTLYRLICMYPQLDRVKYNFSKWNLEVLEWIYTEECQAIVRVREEQAADFIEESLGGLYSFEEISG